MPKKELYCPMSTIYLSSKKPFATAKSNYNIRAARQFSKWYLKRSMNETAHSRRTNQLSRIKKATKINQNTKDFTKKKKKNREK